MINEKQDQSEGVIITETVKNLNSHSICFTQHMISCHAQP